MQRVCSSLTLLGFVCLVVAGAVIPTREVLADSAVAPVRGPRFATKLPGLPATAEAKISATLGREISDYYAQPAPHGFRVESARRSIATDFTAQGIQVTRVDAHWMLSLRSFGYDDALEPVDKAAPVAGLNRVEYRRGPLTEWYVNGPAGLEQGFTVKERSLRMSAGPMTLVLQLSGDLHATLTGDRKGLSLSKRDQKPVLSYTGLAAYDSSGKELAAWMELEGSELLLRVDDRAAAYPITVDPIIQLAKLTASDGMPGDQMGISVVISGNTIVAGAQNATVGSNAAQGAAYVFVKPGSGWADMTETAKLTASDGQAGDGFGGSVGIAGDTIVVGACLQSGMCNGQGKVYVFLKPKNGWTTTSKFKAELTASDGSANDGFSNMLSISGDGKTIAVGAWGATVGGNASEGAAYIFEKPSTGWKTKHETAKLTEAHGAATDDFGNVALSGDGSTLFVGAIQLDTTNNQASGPGKAYIFERQAGGWKTTSKFTAHLTASDGLTGDGFGFCQTGAACISSDGTTVLAAAPQFSATSSGPGKAYIFAKPARGWKTTSHFTAELTASDGNPGDVFGWSPALSNNRAVIGAVGAAAAYVFNKPNSGWKTTSRFNAKLTPADGSKGGFGFSTSISGNTIAVGALTSPRKGGPGATFVFGP